GDVHAARLGAAAERLPQNFVEVDHAHAGGGHARDLEGRQLAGAGVLHLQLDLAVVQFAGAQHAAELAAGVGGGVLADEGVEHALLGQDFGLGLDLPSELLARHVEGYLDEIAHDLLDVAADIADLGELRRLDLDERRLRQLGEPAGDLGLADAGRADHQDVLRQHLLAQLLRQLLAAPAVAERDGHRALGVMLSDDETVEFGHDLARAEARAGGLAGGRPDVDLRRGDLRFGGHRRSTMMFRFV